MCKGEINNMIDIQKLMIQAMKKQLFPEKDGLNIAARQVLGEMKTKIKDIKDKTLKDPIKKGRCLKHRLF